MSGPSKTDPMKQNVGIRDVFEAYKLLMPTTSESRPDLRFVVRHLTRVFDGSPAWSRRVDKESEALEKIRSGFEAYKKLVKWDPEEASKIMIARGSTLEVFLPPHKAYHQHNKYHERRRNIAKTEERDSRCESVMLEQVLQLTDTPPTGQSLKPESQMKQEVVDEDDDVQTVFIKQETPLIVSSTISDPDMIPTSSFSWPLNFVEAILTSSMEMDPEGHRETDFSPVNSANTIAERSNGIEDESNAATTAEAVSERRINTSVEMVLLAKDMIRKQVEVTLQKSGSPYTLTSKGSTLLCHVCNKKYHFLDSLAAHIWRHHTKEPIVFYCPYPQCDLKYAHPSSFSRHVRHCRPEGQTQLSSSLPPTSSDSPGESWTGYWGRRRVIFPTWKFQGEILEIEQEQEDFSVQRSGNRPIASRKVPKSVVCKYCKKSFRDQYSLTNHERTHTGEKPYNCKYCPRAFSRKDQMKGHERTHTGEKNYQCTTCQKKFT